MTIYYFYECYFDMLALEQYKLYSKTDTASIIAYATYVAFLLIKIIDGTTVVDELNGE